MHRTSRLSVLALVLVLLLAGCGGNGSKSDGTGLVDWPESSSVKTGPQIGNRAPNFRLETPDGSIIELATYTGKPVLLNFFASWCANCKEEMTALDTASKNGATVLGINYQESASKVTQLATETGATFPMALDPLSQVSRNGYKVTALPVTILIDGDGVIREIVRGPVDDESIQNLLDSLAASARQGQST